MVRLLFLGRYAAICFLIMFLGKLELSIFSYLIICKLKSVVKHIWNRSDDLKLFFDGCVQSTTADADKSKLNNAFDRLSQATPLAYVPSFLLRYVIKYPANSFFG